jgi:hypothetical protein
MKRELQINCPMKFHLDKLATIWKVFSIYQKYW